MVGHRAGARVGGDLDGRVRGEYEGRGGVRFDLFRCRYDAVEAYRRGEQVVAGRPRGEHSQVAGRRLVCGHCGRGGDGGRRSRLGGGEESGRDDTTTAPEGLFASDMAKASFGRTSAVKNTRTGGDA